MKSDKKYIRDKLYGRSKAFMDNTYHDLDKSKLGASIDDSFFDIACFNAQQALELILKAVLKEYDVPYEKEHDIMYLSNLIEENTDFRFEKQKDMELLADTITSWEEHGRYFDGIRTKEQTVRRVLNIYKDIEATYIAMLVKSNTIHSTTVETKPMEEDAFSIMNSDDGKSFDENSDTPGTSEDETPEEGMGRDDS